MKPLGLNEIRAEYLSFFESRNHLRIPSAPLTPINDTSLLLINSGMAPLKPYFTGREKPPADRVTTCQKCIRTIDIDNIGHTSRHGTFFEMLGNFSFGDYFKEEAILWAWEFMTLIMRIPQEKLSVSVFEEDDDAAQIWRDKVGLDESKIIRLGKDDNFWEVGTGPCGPSSEIYFDRGEQYGCANELCAPGCDCDRFVEIWNLVFTQFDKKEDGSYAKLERSNIDTGMGLERLAVVMQSVDSLFDIDTVKPIRDKVSECTGTPYGALPQTDIYIRIITDHIRSAVFLASDGVLPSNEGAGYVLRRLLRRASMRGRFLGKTEMFLDSLVDTVIDISKTAYPELSAKREHIYNVIRTEETRFNQTVSQGEKILNDAAANLKSRNEAVLSGADAFKLHDTYGFPVDLTKEILENSNLTVDVEGFIDEMRKQKERARAARAVTDYSGRDATIFDGLPTQDIANSFSYDTYIIKDTAVLAMVKDDKQINTADTGDNISLILNETSLYAESGGQKGDTGKITTQASELIVTDCVKISGKTVHVGYVSKGQISVGDKVTVSVDSEHRVKTARNHTATHLLHKALSTVLGPHIEQAGSLVSAERLRFDFTHTDSMTVEQIERVDSLVNEWIFMSLPVTTSEMKKEDAVNIGATALFGEKYGDIVRVVKIGDYSAELCGGTHLDNTSQAQIFKIVSESGIAAGVRRIEALTGTAALHYYKKQEKLLTEAAALLKTSPSNIMDKIAHQTESLRALSAIADKNKSEAIHEVISEIIGKSIEIHGLSVVSAHVGNMDIKTLQLTCDRIREQFDGVVLLAAEHDGKAVFIARASDDAVKKGVHCGELIKVAANVCGGGGGGKPNSAQAGAKDATKINDALKAAELAIGGFPRSI